MTETQPAGVDNGISPEVKAVTAAVASAYDELKSKYSKPFKVPNRLYHYTDTSGLLGIVRGKEIWLSNHAFMNDYSELQHGISLVEQIVKKAREAGGIVAGSEIDQYLEIVLDISSSSNIEIDPYVTCFSEVNNDLNQWRVYGGPVGSFCIEFDGPKLEKSLLRKGIILSPVEYDFQIQGDFIKSIIAHISTIVSQNGYAAALSGEEIHTIGSAVGARISFEISRYKASVFSPEHEWRGVVTGWHSANKVEFRTGKFGLTPYLRVPIADSYDELPIKGITAGPSKYPKQSEYSLITFINSLKFSKKISCSVSNLPIQY